ncbi:ArsR/SmtB family transcription factor [Chryseobacterium sp. JK1]|uniref:ArsR/SmtB family transcription factor n=1 Tax=Chryseobacterium sp. JK1 TaxID=874294 RepID=UPI003D68C097
MENNICIRQQADHSQIDRCKSTISELSYSFDHLSNGIELVGNNVRLKILFLIDQEKQLCVCDLSDILGMSVSAISQHLRKLKDRKLIQSERQAQTIFYSLTEDYKEMLQSIFKMLAVKETL